MSTPLDEGNMRSIAEAAAREQVERLRRELKSGELAGLRTAMAEGFARLTATVETLAEAQRRTEEHVAELTGRVDALAGQVEALTGQVEALTARVDTLAARMDELAQAQARTEERLEALAEAQARTEARLETLAEAQARTEARLEALAEAQARTEERLEALAEAQRRTEEHLAALTHRVEALVEAQRRTEERLQLLTGQQGNMQGQLLEIQFGQRAASYLGRVISGARAFLPSDLERQLQAYLTEQEWGDWLDADWVVMGRPKGQPGGPDVYLVVEVSSVVDSGDVERAIRRAGYLKKAGLDARACVFGHHIHAAAQELASQHGVLVFQDGRHLSG